MRRIRSGCCPCATTGQAPAAATANTEKFPPPHVRPWLGKRDRAPPTSALIGLKPDSLLQHQMLADVAVGSNGTDLY